MHSIHKKTASVREFRLQTIFRGSEASDEQLPDPALAIITSDLLLNLQETFGEVRCDWRRIERMTKKEAGKHCLIGCWSLVKSIFHPPPISVGLSYPRRVQIEIDGRINRCKDSESTRLLGLSDCNYLITT